MKNAVVSKSEVCISNLSRERVIIAIIELVTLRCHSGVSHDDIGIFVKMQVHFVSGEWTFVNCEFAVVVECVASSVSSALLAFLGKNTKQLFTLLRIKGMVVIYQAENCTHVNRPPLS